MELDRVAMKALATRTRQDILKLLRQRPYTASELSRLLSKHVTTVAEHLALLERSGMIQRDEGRKWVYYRLTGKGDSYLNPKNMWSLVLALSAVSMVIGTWLSLQPQFMAYSQRALEITTGADAKTAVPIAGAAEPVSITLILGIVFLSLGILGLVYGGVQYLRARTLRNRILYMSTG